MVTPPLQRPGRRVKDCYRAQVARTGIPWKGREPTSGDFTSGDPVNQAVTAAAQCMYGIGHAKAAGREVCSARPLAVPVRSNGLMCDGQFSRGCSPS